MRFVRPAILLTILAAAAAPAAEPFALQVSGGSPGSILWHRTIATAGDDWINDIVPRGGDRFTLVGFVNRDDDAADSDWVALAVEVDSSGKIHRDRRFGERGGLDAFWATQSRSGGGAVFAGFTTRFGAGGIDGLALFTRDDGSMEAEKAFGGSGYDRLTGVARSGERYAFAGHSQAADSDNRRVFLVITDAAGTELHSRIFEGPGSWGGLYIEPSGDGGFLIAGGASGAGEDSDMFVIKTDGEGREQWRRRVGTDDWDEINHGLIVRPDGTIVLVGYGKPLGATAHDLVAATLTRDGETVRLERFGGPGDERARLPRLAPDGRIWIAGQSDSAGAGSSDAIVTTLDRDGAFTGESILLGSPVEDIGTAVHPLADGTLLVAGYSRALGSDSEDAFVVRLKADSAARLPQLRRTVASPAR